MKQISEHFALDELIVTNTGLLNVPNELHLINLRVLVTNVLEPLRVMYGHPIKINSAFRSDKVNKKIGGAKTSQHCQGKAADLDSENNALLYRLIRDNFTFDQLIWEKGNDNQPAWVHVSFSDKNRMQLLRTRDGKTYFPNPKKA